MDVITDPSGFTVPETGLDEVRLLQQALADG
jgi:hypothetical protein